MQSSQTTEADPQPDATPVPPAQDSSSPPPAAAPPPDPSPATAPPATPTLHHSTTPPSLRTRTGKIARLPHEIRGQINTRLLDGEPAGFILDWLNNLPEVQSILFAQFGGAAVNKVNLHAWKCGGYREWLARQDALEKANSDFLRKKQFRAPTERPEIREKLFPDEVEGLTLEILAKIEKELNLL